MQFNRGREKKARHDRGKSGVFGHVLSVVLVMAIRAMVRASILMRMMRRRRRRVVMMKLKAPKDLVRVPRRKEQRDQKQKLPALTETIHQRRERYLNLT